MFNEIVPQVFREIRVRARLKVGELAAAMNKQRQTINRIERGQQFPTPDQEVVLIKKANLSRKAFVEVVCKVLTDFLGQRVMIVPELRYMPTSPLEVAARLYNEHREKLDSDLRERIEAKLHQGRALEATADQTTSLFEKEIRDLIKQALAARSGAAAADGLK